MYILPSAKNHRCADAFISRRIRMDSSHPEDLFSQLENAGRIEILEDGIEQRIKKRFVEADSNLGLLPHSPPKKTKKPPTRRQRLFEHYLSSSLKKSSGKCSSYRPKKRRS